MASPPRTSDYFADTEDSSDSDSYFKMGSPPLKIPASYNPKRSQRVIVRTPSEEELYQDDKLFDRSRRRPATYSYTHNSSHSNKKTSKDKQKRDDQPQVTDRTPPAPPAAAPGFQPYNNPGGTTAHLGANQIHLHNGAIPNAYLSGQQPFIISGHPNTPHFQAYQYPGQPAPFIVNGNTNGTMDGYQNSAPANTGLHFQPQTPDTSLGPMYHQYIPRFDDGGAFAAHPGIVCHHVPSFISLAPLSPFLTFPNSAASPRDVRNAASRTGSTRLRRRALGRRFPRHGSKCPCDDDLGLQGRRWSSCSA